eukprot:7769189-Pyramimonas_sp.AAC.1
MFSPTSACLLLAERYAHQVECSTNASPSMSVTSTTGDCATSEERCERSFATARHASLSCIAPTAHTRIVYM